VLAEDVFVHQFAVGEEVDHIFHLRAPGDKAVMLEGFDFRGGSCCGKRVAGVNVVCYYNAICPTLFFLWITL
jgi:hypothetical protein